MNARNCLIFPALFLLVSAQPASAETAIPGGDSATTVLQPGSVNSEFYVPVPEGATHLDILVEGKRPAVNVDLYLRYASPFADTQAGGFLDGALYQSVGPDNLEFLDITFASAPPVSPGRWYLGLVNLDPEKPTEVTITVAVRSEAEPTLKPLEIEVVYSDGAGFGFNSGSLFQAQGGNNAATLGGARKRALEKAIEILEESFTSPVPIRMEARFETIESDPNGGAPLAFAGPTCVARDFPGAPRANTWYAQPIVPRLAGTDPQRMDGEDCGDGVDLRATFNTSPPDEWWYGLQPTSTIGDGFDFVSVALHEILHGLGYLSLADVETGELFTPEGDLPRSDIFTDQLHVFRNGEEVSVAELTDQQRLDAFTSNGRLYWLGEMGDDVFWPAVQEQIGQTGNIHPAMYSPSTPDPGSSVSHTFFHDIMYYEGTQAAAANEGVNLRSSGPDLGSAYYFLRDAGWSEEPREQLEGPVMPTVPRGMWYDRARNGHGFDFQRVGDNWFLVFFTYDDAGNPEWYLAVGALEDGVFSGTLQRFTYDDSDPDGDGTPLTAEDVGSVELAFEASAGSPACDDGVDRGNALALARFSWEIDGRQGDWCAEPLPLPGSAPTPDFTGHWFGGQGDPGWGMTIYLREDDGTQILVDTLYFFDGAGNPRWAQGVQPDFINSHGDQTIDMQQFQGYARTSDCTPGGCDVGASSSAGVVRLRLKQPVQGQDAASRATTNVDYLGEEGGTWRRQFVTLEMLSDPS